MGQVITKETLKELISGIIAEQAGALTEDQEKKFAMLIESKYAEHAAALEKKFVPQDTEGKKNQWKDFGEFAHAVYRSSKGLIDSRLAMKAAGSPAQAENDMEAGGYLIPEEFRAELLTLALEKSVILSRCTNIPMATNVINIPVVNGFDHSGGLVFGGVQFLWLNEEGSYTSKNMKFARVQLRLDKVTGLSYMSEELLEDSPISAGPLVTSAFGDALVWTLDDVFINGSGAGKPLGILNSPCKVTTTKETGQAAATIVWENVIKMYAHLWRDAGAIWMANRSCLPQLASMSLAVGTGGLPVFLPANGASGKPYNTLFGIPLMFSEHCPALGTEGDLILVDWSQYLCGQKAAGNGMKTATSIHFRFDVDQLTYKFAMRVAGQSWWPTYLTPHKGTNYLSPVVTLGTRS